MNLRGFITHKLEEQTEFVRWWKETVGIRQSPGNNQHSSNADLRSTIPKDDAESLTGITQQQVSKWAKKLQKPEQYRAQLFGAANYNRERNSTAATSIKASKRWLRRWRIQKEDRGKETTC